MNYWIGVLNTNGGLLDSTSLVFVFVFSYHTMMPVSCASNNVGDR